MFSPNRRLFFNMKITYVYSRQDSNYFGLYLCLYSSFLKEGGEGYKNTVVYK